MKSEPPATARTEPAFVAEPREDEHQEKHGRSLQTFVWWPAAMALLYTLSFGPVDHFLGVGSPAVNASYAPRLWAYRHVPPFRVVFDSYMGLWDKRW
jgi:hypothetical protein